MILLRQMIEKHKILMGLLSGDLHSPWMVKLTFGPQGHFFSVIVSRYIKLAFVSKINAIAS